MNIGEVTLTLTGDTAHFLTYTSLPNGEFQFCVNKTLAWNTPFPVRNPPKQINVKVWIDADYLKANQG
jgi:hypothetical protein